MFGAVYGDVLGSYYEVHCTKDYNFTFQKDSHFTDDSVLITAVCQAILNNPSEIGRFGIRKRAKEYAAHYRQYFSRFPYAGFGQMFSEWAKNYNSRNRRSYANGAAMRVVPIAYAYQSLEQILLQVKASCISTHNNRAAIKAASAVATAVYFARQGKSKDYIRSFIEKTYKYNLSIPLELIRKYHIFDSEASYSVPPAIIAFLESSDYESAVRGAISLGGDADTQGCIAGAIAEAYYKKIPDDIERFCNLKIDSSIKATIRKFNAIYNR